MKDILIGTWAWGTGANGSSMVFGSKQDPEILKQSFEEAVKLGFTNWDTAAVYGMGSCEKLLGTLIKGRDDIFISTKFFPRNISRASSRSLSTRAWNVWEGITQISSGSTFRTISKQISWKRFRL